MFPRFFSNLLQPSRTGGLPCIPLLTTIVCLKQLYTADFGSNLVANTEMTNGCRWSLFGEVSEKGHKWVRKILQSSLYLSTNTPTRGKQSANSGKTIKDSGVFAWMFHETRWGREYQRNDINWRWKCVIRTSVEDLTSSSIVSPVQLKQNSKAPNLNY